MLVRLDLCRLMWATVVAVMAAMSSLAPAALRLQLARAATLPSALALAQTVVRSSCAPALARLALVVISASQVVVFALRLAMPLRLRVVRYPSLRARVLQLMVAA